MIWKIKLQRDTAICMLTKHNLISWEKISAFDSKQPFYNKTMKELKAAVASCEVKASLKYFTAPGRKQQKLPEEGCGLTESEELSM